MDHESTESTVQRPNPDTPNQQVARQLRQQIRPDWNFLRQSNRVRKPHLGGSTWSHQQKMQPVFLHSVRLKLHDWLECIQALPRPCQSQHIYSQRRGVWWGEPQRTMIHLLLGKQINLLSSEVLPDYDLLSENATSLDSGLCLNSKSTVIFVTRGNYTTILPPSYCLS